MQISVEGPKALEPFREGKGGRWAAVGKELRSLGAERRPELVSAVPVGALRGRKQHVCLFFKNCFVVVLQTGKMRLEKG